MKKIISIIILILLVAAGGAGYYFYKVFLGANINANPESATYKYLYVKPNDTWNDVVAQLDSNGWVSSVKDLQTCIEYLEKEAPECGKYDLEPNLGNRNFVNRLAYSLSNKARVQLKMTRYTTWVARNLARQLPVDSASLADVFLADTLLRKYGLTKESSLALFVRMDTAVQWCLTPKEVETCVLNARERFWNEERRAKARKTGLSLKDIHILASIVEEETNNAEDRRMVAGVYLNRLKKRMPLQACPTARYAAGDFSLNRILKKHTKIDSPYNTYKYAGLPPGPIRIPSAKAIDAVLDFVPHKYLYFCAKADFSGTHNYATTFSEHSRNARDYQRALNKRIREQRMKK